MNWPVSLGLRAAVMTVLALVSTACSAGWSRQSLSALETVPARQQVQVWRGRQSSIFHGVRADSTAIRGIPYQKRLDCDTCYVSMPRAEVDSVRYGDLSNGLWKSVALGVGVLVGVTYVACLRGGCGGT